MHNRLPDLSLPRVPDGIPVSLRPRGREGAVVLLVHGGDCAECATYLRGLGEVQEQLQDWDGRIVVVAPEAPEAAARIASRFPVLADPDGRCAVRCGLAGGGAMIIADQWGEIFFTETGGAARHELPAPSEVVEWLRFVAIQCPECQGEAL